MKIKKRMLKRILFAVMLVVTLINCFSIICSVPVFAEDGESSGGGFNIVGLLDEVFIGGFSLMFSGIPFIIITAFKLLLVILGVIIQALMSGVYSSLEGSMEIVSLHDIIFAGTGDASKFLDINFFNRVGDAGAFGTFSDAIAQWYYILRALSAAILLVILIYVGIRMALSNVGQEQAKYKQMFVDWVTSVALLFLLHYIVSFVIAVNTSLVGAIASISEDPIKDMILNVVGMVFWPGIEGIFSSLIYLGIIGQIFSFFVLYVRRMITVAFLIMIAPLICITYSIDKIGDGKAQALNNWLREITYNILIQPFHCVIYVAFFGAINNMIDENLIGMTPYILAILVMQFMKKAEEILKKIFKFDTSSSGSLSESAQSLANMRGSFVKIGAGAGMAFAGFKAAGGIKGLKESVTDIRAGRAARKEMKDAYKAASRKKSAKGFGKYRRSGVGKAEYADLKAQKLTEFKEEKDRKDEEKIEKNYDKKHGTGSYKKDIKSAEKNAVEGLKVDARAEELERKAFDAEHGEGKYDELKRKATSKNKKTSKKANEKLNEFFEDKKDSKTGAPIEGKRKKIRKEAENELKQEAANSVRAKAKEETQWAPKRAINGIKETYGEFSNSRTGKLIIAGAKDISEVVAAIGAGAVAYGASNEMNDAISAGQLFYGFAKGTFEGSNKTVTLGTTDNMKKLLEVSGSKVEDSNKIMNSIKFSGDAGLYKAIDDLQKKLIAEIRKVVGDKEKANDFITALKFNASQEGAAINLDKLIDDLGIADEADKRKIASKSTEFATTLLESRVYENIKQADSIGTDVDTLSTKVETKLEKVADPQTGKIIINTSNNRNNSNS